MIRRNIDITLPCERKVEETGKLVLSCAWLLRVFMLTAPLRLFRPHSFGGISRKGERECFSGRFETSDLFCWKNTMQRHRMIYGALSEEFSEGLHALTLQTKTPQEAGIPEDET